MSTQIQPSDNDDFISFNNNIYTLFKPDYSINNPPLPKIQISQKDTARLSEPREVKPIKRIPLVQPGT